MTRSQIIASLQYSIEFFCTIMKSLMFSKIPNNNEMIESLDTRLIRQDRRVHIIEGGNMKVRLEKDGIGATERRFTCLQR